MVDVLLTALLALGLAVSLVIKLRAFVGFVIGSAIDSFTGPKHMEKDTVVAFWVFVGCLVLDGIMIWGLTSVA